MVSSMAEQPQKPTLNEAKEKLRTLGRRYVDRLERARRIYIEERAAVLGQHRDVEYEIKSRIAKHYGIPYRAVCFAGSAQLGFSINKDRLFVPAASDLDVACVDLGLFERAWTDAVSVTRAFTDETKFSGLEPKEIQLFKESILRRGMIRVELMPRSDQSNKWRRFEESLSRSFAQHFGKISCAIYMSEYAFCWKQDTTLQEFLGPLSNGK